MIVQAVRSTLFYLAFFVHTFFLALLVGTMAKLMPTRRKSGWAIVRYWSVATLFLLRWLVGIRSEVTGMTNLPEGAYIVAAKHQSDWDIFAILPHMGQPAFIAKKELLAIPFFGWAAAWMNAVPVDRKRGRDAVPLMLASAQEAVDRGCEVIIYPEGTRRAPLEAPAYRSGIIRMYVALGVPVVPVALTSGLYWGRNSPVLWPGKARARFLPPIAPGLAPAEFEERLIAAIEGETDRMILEDVQAGLARPISPRLRARIAELEARMGQAS
ncbi:lysophospholipid acyltransferase family protein [Pelagibacterium montanilacus]|uniref:lysophospholipid acyltransferase family protein n=1 Tax=Pelagibacterium montanilacus TaxID=2185280 RepID=UPI000F8F0CA9|nr:1-acyl-sn-glycerol-3-phosphate acyltransferase [Pelagibacterium montanilacus]